MAVHGDYQEPQSYYQDKQMNHGVKKEWKEDDQKNKYHKKETHGEKMTHQQKETYGTTVKDQQEKTYGKKTKYQQDKEHQQKEHYQRKRYRMAQNDETIRRRCTISRRARASRSSTM
jgi:hypothetical protein